MVDGELVHVSLTTHSLRGDDIYPKKKTANRKISPVSMGLDSFGKIPMKKVLS